MATATAFVVWTLPTELPDDRMTKIMSLNGWGGTLCDALLPYLSSVAPDILCLQEAISSDETERDWLTYRDGDHVLPRGIQP